MLVFSSCDLIGCQDPDTEEEKWNRPFARLSLAQRRPTCSLGMRLGLKAAYPDTVSKYMYLLPSFMSLLASLASFDTQTIFLNKRSPLMAIQKQLYLIRCKMERSKG